MVATTDLHHTGSNEMSKGKIMAGCLVSMAVGAVIGYLMATASEGDCCTVLGTGKQGIVDASGTCVPKPRGTTCRIVTNATDSDTQ